MSARTCLMDLFTLVPHRHLVKKPTTPCYLVFRKFQPHTNLPAPALHATLLFRLITPSACCEKALHAGHWLEAHHWEHVREHSRPHDADSFLPYCFGLSTAKRRRPSVPPLPLDAANDCGAPCWCAPRNRFGAIDYVKPVVPLIVQQEQHSMCSLEQKCAERHTY